MTAELVCAATDPAWLERRREGITATDIVTIAGLVTWDSPWALYHRKLGLLPEVEQSDRMRLGSWLEDAVAHHWSLCADRPNGWMRQGNLYRSDARTWQMSTADRVLAASKYGSDLVAVLECKTADRYQTGWGADGTDQVPAHVRAQVLWQMDTLGVGTGHVAVVFLPSGEFRSYTIRHQEPHDHDPVTELSTCGPCNEIGDLRDLGFGFWSRILTRRPPDLDGLEVTTDALRYLHPAPGGQIEVRQFDADVYDAVSLRLKNAKAEMVQTQNTIRGFMGDAHEATVDGKVVFRRTVGKRAGYVVPPAVTDTLRRIGKDKHDD